MDPTKPTGLGFPLGHQSVQFTLRRFCFVRLNNALVRGEHAVVANQRDRKVASEAHADDAYALYSAIVFYLATQQTKPIGDRARSVAAKKAKLLAHAHHANQIATDRARSPIGFVCCVAR